MTGKDLIRALRTRWLLVISGLLAGLLVGSAVYLFVPATYTAKVSMYIFSQGAESPNSAYQGAQLSEQRIASYVELAASPRIARQIVDNLASPFAPDELQKKLSAYAQPGSIVITISARDGSPQVATELANSAGDAFVNLVRELESPNSPGAVPQVAARIVEPAVDAPRTSSGLRSTLGFGLAIGLALGIGAALLRHSTDTIIRSSERLASASDLPPLGETVEAAKDATANLPVYNEAHSVEAEAYRLLRSNLAFTNVDKRNKIIQVTSPLPSDGKSTITANLALAAATSGSSVVLVEGDLRKPSLSRILGVDSHAGVSEVMAGRAQLSRAVQQLGYGFAILTSGRKPPNPNELLSSANFQKMLNDLATQYDLVIVDSPPVLAVSDAAVIASVVDGVILVARYGTSSTTETRAAVNALKRASANCLGTVLVGVPAKLLTMISPYSSSYYARDDAQ